MIVNMMQRWRHARRVHQSITSPNPELTYPKPATPEQALRVLESMQLVMATMNAEIQGLKEERIKRIPKRVWK